MSDLVGNPEDRFSRVAAHMRSAVQLVDQRDCWFSHAQAQLISVIVYATQELPCLFFFNLKLQASNHIM